MALTPTAAEASAGRSAHPDLQSCRKSNAVHIRRCKKILVTAPRRRTQPGEGLHLSTSVSSSLKGGQGLPHRLFQRWAHPRGSTQALPGPYLGWVLFSPNGQPGDPSGITLRVGRCDSRGYGGVGDFTAGAKQGSSRKGLWQLPKPQAWRSICTSHLPPGAN